MKCQKCAKTAAVHLTELAKDSSGNTQMVEIHLCLQHAVEAGLVAPGSEVLPQLLNTSPVLSQKKPKVSPSLEDMEPTNIPPQASNETPGLVPARATKSTEPEDCPVCGLSWTQFKHGGLFGCAHDYVQFESRIGPLLKRAQEGAKEHVGKVPTKLRNHGDRQVVTLRLRRDLQKAIDAENYEKAARLRDELRQIEQN